MVERVVVNWDELDAQHKHLFEIPEPDIKLGFRDAWAAYFTPSTDDLPVQPHTMMASAKRLYPRASLRRGDPDFGPVSSLKRFMTSFEALGDKRRLIFRIRLKTSDTAMIRFVRTRIAGCTSIDYALFRFPETDLERKELQSARMPAGTVSVEMMALGGSDHSATITAPCSLYQGEAHTQDRPSRPDPHFGYVRRRNLPREALTS